MASDGGWKSRGRLGTGWEPLRTRWAGAKPAWTGWEGHGGSLSPEPSPALFCPPEPSSKDGQGAPRGQEIRDRRGREGHLDPHPRVPPARGGERCPQAPAPEPAQAGPRKGRAPLGSRQHRAHASRRRLEYNSLPVSKSRERVIWKGENLGTRESFPKESGFSWLRGSLSGSCLTDGKNQDENSRVVFCFFVFTQKQQFSLIKLSQIKQVSPCDWLIS